MKTDSNPPGPHTHIPVYSFGRYGFRAVDGLTPNTNCLQLCWWLQICIIITGCQPQLWVCSVLTSPQASLCVCVRWCMHFPVERALHWVSCTLFVMHTFCIRGKKQRAQTTAATSIIGGTCVNCGQYPYSIANKPWRMCPMGK